MNKCDDLDYRAALAISRRFRRASEHLRESQDGELIEAARALEAIARAILAQSMRGCSNDPA